MRVDAPVMLRDAVVSDAEAIGVVHAEAWKVAYRDLFEAGWLERFVAKRRSQWASRFRMPEFARTTLLLAVRGDQVSAFTFFGPYGLMSAVQAPVPDGHDDDGEIYGCYAHPSVWGTGVAATLLDATLDRLADNGYPRVRLWTLAGANRARRFYFRSGFEESGATRERDFGDGRPVLELEYAREA
jgi:RimJ/RimL family protein N-acetyltransferase